MQKWYVGPLLLLLAGCGLKNLTAVDCPRAILAAVVSVPAAAPDCRHDAICDVRVFDPHGEDSNGVPFLNSLAVGDGSASLQIFRYNTFAAVKDAADSSEYDRTEVACYFPSSSLRVEKVGRDSSVITAAAAEAQAKCLSGVKP